MHCVAGLSGGRIGRIAGETVVVAAGSVLAAIGALASVSVLTEILDPSAYGEVALAMTAVLLLQQTWTGPIGQSAMRHYVAAVESARLRDHLCGVWDLFLGGLVPIMAFLALAMLWTPEAGAVGWPALAGLACLLAAVSGAGGIMDDMQSAARNRRVVATHQGLASWLRILGAYAAVHALGPSSSAAMIGMVGAAAAVWGSQYAFYRRRLDRARGMPRSDASGTAGLAEWRAQLVVYAWPFAAWGVFGWAQIASERWAIASFVSTAELGKYAALYQIGFVPMAFASQIAAGVLAPILFARCGTGNDRIRVSRTLAELDSTILAAVLAVLGLVAVAYAFHVEIVGIMLAGPYRDLAHLLPVLAASGGAIGVGQLAALGPMAQGRPASLLAPKIGSGIGAAALVIVGAWSAGVTGVAWGSLGGSLIYAVWQLAQARSLRLRRTDRASGYA